VGDDDVGTVACLQKSGIPAREKAAIALELKRNGRSSIFSSPLDVMCDFEPPIYDKSSVDEAFLRSVMNEHILFQDLSSDELSTLIGATERVNLEDGERAVRQKAKGEYLFIVQDGSLDMFCDVNQKHLGTVGTGHVFGEMALLWGKEYDVSIIAKGSSVLWRLEQIIYRNVVARHACEQDADIVDNLRKVTIFQLLEDSILQKIVSSLTRVSFRPGEAIIRKGEIGETFYIIETGSVRVHDIGIGDSRSSDFVLHDGDSFGERSLLTGERRAAAVSAITDVKTFAIDRRTFEENIADLQESLDVHTRRQYLKSLPILSHAHLMENEFDRLAMTMQQFSYRKGTKLVEIGQQYPKKIWFLQSGQVIVFGNKSGKIYNLLAGDYFGEKSIMSPTDHISSHEAICEENVNAWVISREDIESLL